MHHPFNDYTPAISQAEASVKIDQLVDDALRRGGQAYSLQSHPDMPYHKTKLGDKLDYLSQMLALFDGRMDYDYSENLELFYDACHDIRLECIDRSYICPDPESNGGFLSEPEVMNLLIERIRELSKQEWYQRRARDRRYQAKRQAEDISEFVQRVMDRYSKTLVLRLNLYYRETAKQRLTIEQVFDDMNKLARARRTNPIFEHLVASIIRVEQGEDQGFHLHVAFFFNGSQVWRHFRIAERIGELWAEITQGGGHWHDSSREWDGEEDDRGTGMFLRRDEKGRYAVASLMAYLVKDKGQHLRIRPAGVRAYRTGCIR
ncbi:hypothetical protein MFKK_30430 [Halopseudomonas aestusnigri]|uniref:YagK/YfjJ domain-containing protein n=1 Tax=Halopseudomonas TaxID=2901189 RepID=UPI0022B61628|nr:MULTISPECIES: inovirus-type Gp2 protein [Halopseudomonas]BDX20233.1 hypothetical protein MFKK_30430 [Halopseudomonas aestusnigri]